MDGRKKRKVEGGLGQHFTAFLASGKDTSVATKQTTLKVVSGVEWYATKVVREIVEVRDYLTEVQNALLNVNFLP